MQVKFGERGFEIDRNWTDSEYEAMKQEIMDRQSYGYYQKIVIRDAGGRMLETPGHHNTTGVMPLLDAVGFPMDFGGQSVLDIGCNAGFYSIMAKLRGAGRVLGIDHNLFYVEHARMVARILGIPAANPEFRLGDENDFASGAEKFDFVINTGVMYHLQNPMDFLVKVAAITNKTMLMESEMLTDPKLTEYAWFIEKTYGQDLSNWWIYGPKCLEGMARAAGFREVEFKGFIWKPEPGTKVQEGYERQGRGVFICRK